MNGAGQSADQGVETSTGGAVETWALAPGAETTEERDSGVGPRPSASPLPRGSSRGLAGELRLVACLMFGLVIVHRGWLCDDAFISLRSVEHLVTGRGLVFNVGERVQSFTNPLWVLLLAVPHWLFHEPYAVLLVSGLLVSFTACWVIGWVIAPTPLLGALGLALLTASEAYGDFSTSGLENPLSHLLVLGTLAFLLHPLRWRRWPWAPWLCAGLALSTRLDNGVLLACGLVALAVRQYEAFAADDLEGAATSAHLALGSVSSHANSRMGHLRRRALRRVFGFAAVGLAPFVAWELFALVYFGTLVPNTALAKLGVNLPRHEVLGQGVVYLLTSLERDPLTLLLITTGAILGLRSSVARPVAAGVVLHLVYVIAVGGDFMAGRFLTVPTAAAVAVILHGFGAATRGPSLPRAGGAFAGFAALAALVVALSPYRPFGSGGPRTIPPTGIVSERDFYRPELGLLPNLRARAYQTHGFWRDGLAFRRGDQRVVVHDNAGLTAYAAGSDKHLVDGAGLTDPLLARVPFPYVRDWRVGHYGRPLPAGYRETLETGENRIEDPYYRELYEKLSLVTRGPLLSRDRLEAIYELQTGSFSAARNASP